MGFWDAFSSGNRVVATSGNVANAVAAASITPTSLQRAYTTGFEVTGLGATSAATILATLSNLIGSVTFTYIIQVPAGVTTAISALSVHFDQPIPAASVGTAITISVPAFGSGNTNVCVNLEGFVSSGDLF